MYTFSQVRLNEADAPDSEPSRRTNLVWDTKKYQGSVNKGWAIPDASDPWAGSKFQVDGGHFGSAKNTQLKAHTDLGYHLGLSWSSLRASAFTSASTHERFTINWYDLKPQPDWQITWLWTVHGDFTAQVHSVPGPYGVMELDRNMTYQHIVSADLDMHWSLDGQATERGNVYHEDIHRTLWDDADDDMRRGSRLLPLGNGFRFMTPTTSHTDFMSRPRTNISYDITVGTATRMETWFELNTAVNLGFYNIDSSASLEGVLDAQFGQTAELTTIQLRDGQGRPIYGDWRLIADSGFEYPVQYQPVPEPGTWALVALGLLALGLRARRRGDVAVRR